MAPVLMTPAEIHDFGVGVVFKEIKNQGHEIASVNTNLGTNPQIVARKDGQLEFILVRTACYPSKGTLENEQVAITLLARASKFGATCYFASVGIANATTPDGMEVPVKGAGFHVTFSGLQSLSQSGQLPSQQNEL